MMRTYQISKEGDYGVSKKIAPFTTEEVHNELTCFQVNGNKEDPVEAQGVLPDITNFTVNNSVNVISRQLNDLFLLQLIGNEIMNGVTCEKWEYLNNYGDKSNRYTLWLQRQVTFKQACDFAVFAEILGFNYKLFPAVHRNPSANHCSCSL
jgi:hypothetical protein